MRMIKNLKNVRFDKKTITKESVEKEKQYYKYKEYSVECTSHWLSISFIFAFLLLLF